MKGVNQLLSAVSRSFYLSMRFLPRAMRPGIAVGYLLARATDTVADSVDLNHGERLLLLKMMGQIIAQGASHEVASTCFGQLGVLSSAQSHLGEAELLARFPECLALLESLSPREQQAVRRVLAIIVDGQVWDLEYFESHSAVVCEEQLEHYTYMVAGCVGEFWTRMGLLAMGQGFSTQSEEQLLIWGRHYGMGLQLVNILRDRAEDAQRGRIYLPSAELQPWLKRAEHWLKEGVFYAESLRNGRLRFSTVLPAWLGLDTLSLLCKEANRTSSEKVKVTRGHVYSLMWKAFLFSWKQAL